MAPFKLEAVEASLYYFFEHWWKKLKYPNLLKPLGTIIQQNYWCFYPSELIYFALFTMRHPVGPLPFRAYLFSLTFSEVPESSPLIAIALISSLNNYDSHFKFMNLLGLPFRAYLFKLTFSDIPESSQLIIAIALISSLNYYYSHFKFMNLLGLPFWAYLF